MTPITTAQVASSETNMQVALVSYESAFEWLDEAAKVPPRLLLGNGFSVSFDSGRFSYRALRQRAETEDVIGPLATQLFTDLNTFDFEEVIQALTSSARTLRLLNPAKYEVEIVALESEAAALKDVLAKTLAALHPERPANIPDDAYLRVRTFLDTFKNIYTTNYDLLLYWASMQDTPPLESKNRYNDGFRDPGYDAKYVIWDAYEPMPATVHYIHGALHLFRASDSGELQKLTWVRTNDALIDQIRRQLEANRFPLIVTEGSSASKLAKIHTSDYLGRALRSLAGISGGLMVYGLSLSDNDSHLVTAIVRSSVSRLAVSIYGDLESETNQATVRAAQEIVSERADRRPDKPIEVRFFDASSVRLWQ